MTVTGSGFTRATAVLFGTTPATKLERVSATTLRATAPPHAGGTFDVRVTTPGGTSPVSARARYPLRVAPRRQRPLGDGRTAARWRRRHGHRVAPRQRQPGAVRRGRGQWSRPRLRHDPAVTAPAGRRCHGPRRERRRHEPRHRTRDFTYVGVPTVTTLSTPAGPLAGGTVVTSPARASACHGRLRRTPGTALVRVSDTELRVTSPARPEGTVTLLVTTPGGVSAAGAAASFTYQPVPTVARSPGLARTRGGDVVTVTGTASTASPQ